MNCKSKTFLDGAISITWTPGDGEGALLTIRQGDTEVELDLDMATLYGVAETSCEAYDEVGGHMWGPGDVLYRWWNGALKKQLAAAREAAIRLKKEANEGRAFLREIEEWAYGGPHGRDVRKADSVWDVLEKVDTRRAKWARRAVDALAHGEALKSRLKRAVSLAWRWRSRALVAEAAGLEKDRDFMTAVTRVKVLEAEVARLRARVDGSSGRQYFVIDLYHDESAVPALRAYADSCEATRPALAFDLRAWCNMHWHGESMDTAQDTQPGAISQDQLEEWFNTVDFEQFFTEVCARLEDGQTPGETALKLWCALDGQEGGVLQEVAARIARRYYPAHFGPPDGDNVAQDEVTE